MSFEHRLPVFDIVSSQVADAMDAVSQEMAASGLSSVEPVEVEDGRLLSSMGATSLWSFAAHLDDWLQIGTRGALRVGTGQRPIPVELVAIGDNDVVISSRELLPLEDEQESLSGVIEFVPTGVLGALQGRLESVLGDPAIEDSLALELLSPDHGAWVQQESLDNDPTNISAQALEDQERAAQRAVEPGIRFTWGPPGTGKTTVLANAVANAVIAGQRVLVLSHSNVAVDVAMLRVASVLEAEHDIVNSHQVLRVGTPRLEAMLDRRELLPESIAMSQRPDLESELEQISQRLKAISAESRTANEVRGQELAVEATELRKTYSQIGLQLADVERSLISDAQVLGTTLAKAVIDDTIWNWDADVIIIDEASMAGLPFILALTTQNATTVSLFGDFRQLPSIAIADTETARRWFATDVFEFAQVQHLYERGEPDQRISILRVQFRMGENICETVNALAYDGMLRTHPAARNRAIKLCDAEPSPGAEIVIMDTSKLGLICEVSQSVDSYSRINWYSAAISATLAQQLASQFDSEVGLLSPYRLQAQLMARITSELDYVDAATVHRFQGGERAAVVLDLTDDSPLTASSFLSGNDADTSLRLMNVAASRAIGKLVIVVNQDFIDKYHGLSSGTLRLLDAAQNSGAETVDAATQINEWIFQPRLGPMGPRWFENTLAAIDYIMQLNESHPYLPIECNLPTTEVDLSSLTNALISSGDRQGRITVRGPARLVGSLDPEVFDVRLQLAGMTPWIAIGAYRVIGLENFAGPTVVCHSTYLRTIIQQHFLPVE